jgi:hypothetical protein
MTGGKEVCVAKWNVGEGSLLEGNFGDWEGLGREEYFRMEGGGVGDGKEVGLVWEGKQVLHLVEGRQV